VIVMTVKVLEQKKNPLLKREEVRATLEHQGKPTPSREEMLPILERLLKTKRELILIDKIFSVKGKGESLLKIFTYSKKEDIPEDKKGMIEKRMERKKEKGEKTEEAKPEGEKEAQKKGEGEKEGEPEDSGKKEEAEKRPEEKPEEAKSEEEGKEEKKG
jgi:ribosomal protein S24E